MNVKTAYFDCQFGAAGDMLLGALIDAGLDYDKWLAEVAKISLPAEAYKIELSQVHRRTLAAKKLDVIVPVSATEQHYHHEHEHSHGDVIHRHQHIHDSAPRAGKHEADHQHSHDEHYHHEHEHSHGVLRHRHDHTHSEGLLSPEHELEHGHGQDGHINHEHGHSHGELNYSHEHIHGRVALDHSHQAAHEHTAHEHEHSHSGGAHEHSHHCQGGPAIAMARILEIIEVSDISSEAKSLAEKIVRRLGNSEAAVHGMSGEVVYFHEVGAIDSIIDMVGFAIAYHLLGIEKSYVSAVPIGRGHVLTAHGRFPVPAPAVAFMLAEVNAPTVDYQIDFECLTPTATAILAEICPNWGAMPAFEHVTSIGYGAGSVDSPAHPNVCRVMLGVLQPALVG